MSDFDKEAEREKLREKYEREEEKREATEQMSELLLKGATMTNAHCSDCGDPIFRYDGQEFCPTCQRPVDRDASGRSDDAGAPDTDDSTTDEPAAESGASAGTNGAAGDDGIEVTSPRDDASVRFGGESTDAAAGERDRTSDAEERPVDAREPTTADPAAGPVEGSESDRTSGDDVRRVGSVDPDETSPVESGSTGRAADAETDGSASEHLGRARVVLARTVERYAELAAAAESPREARDHLETAREAAETLDATEF